MTIPKRPSHSTRPPPPTVGTSQRPSNIKDALTEARAVAGGGLGRPVTASSGLARAGLQGKKTVLVVDDDASMRSRVRTALEEFYDVLEAKDGMEAAELMASIQPPALIVCDVVMPRVDGFTLAKILRANPVTKRVPIMFLSSRNSPQDVTQALVLGASQYVLKSVPMGEIVAKVRKIAM